MTPQAIAASAAIACGAGFSPIRDLFAMLRHHPFIACEIVDRRDQCVDVSVGDRRIEQRHVPERGGDAGVAEVHAVLSGVGGPALRR